MKFWLILSTYILGTDCHYVEPFSNQFLMLLLLIVKDFRCRHAQTEIVKLENLKFALEYGFNQSYHTILAIKNIIPLYKIFNFIISNS